MTDNDKAAIKEAAKTIARNAVIAALPVALIYFQDVNTWWGVTIWALLVGVDRFVHKSDRTELTGLVQL